MYNCCKQPGERKSKHPYREKSDIYTHKAVTDRVKEKAGDRLNYNNHPAPSPTHCLIPAPLA
jgi:hypothetical protein